MRGRAFLATLAALPLAACDVDHGAATQTDSKVHVAVAGGGDKANQLSLDLPGFAAKMNLPDVRIGKNMDLDGIRLAGGTEVKTIDVDDHDRDTDGKGDSSGQVKLSFTAPEAPAALVAYYRAQAAQAGYGDIAASDAGLKATKGDKSFTLAADAEGKGSRGTILLTGK